MRFSVDHDYHIHSVASLCCHDQAQTPQRILQYALENGLKKIVITDHYWDETVAGASDWYKKQDHAHVSSVLPLPEAQGVEFLFGCETDMDKFCTVGISKQRYDCFDFIVIPTTHLHMTGFTIEKDATLEQRARAYVERLEALFEMDLPFHKIGIAHLTCTLLATAEPDDHIKVIDMIADGEYERLFTRAAELGVGIELNFSIERYTDSELQRVLRPYRIAKKCGCKFYLASDAHSVASLDRATKKFEAIISALELEEEDKFVF